MRKFVRHAKNHNSHTDNRAHTPEAKVPTEKKTRHTAVMACAAQDDVVRAQRLWDAAQQGHTCEVLKLVHAHDCTALSKALSNALSVAASNDHTDALMVLLHCGAAIDGGAGCTVPLTCAVARNSIAAARALLRAKACVNRTDLATGTTPVYVAAKCGHAACVRMLVGAKADVHTPMAHGHAPVHAGAMGGSALGALVEAGVDVDMVTVSGGLTPVYIAAYEGHTEALHVLISANADVNKTSALGFTAAYIASEFGLADVVQALIDAKADVDKTTAAGCTPTYIACERGHLDVLRQLTRARADVNLANADGFTPIYRAAFAGYADVVELLAHAGADVDGPTQQGFTPVSAAAERGATDALRTLIQLKADVNRASRDGATPLWCAALHGQTETLQILVDVNADVNGPRSDGATPVMAAAHNGHHDVLRQLHRFGADMTRCMPMIGWTALMLAAGSGFPAAIQFLLSCAPELARVATLQEHNWWDTAVPAGSTPLDVARLLQRGDDVVALLP